ncbi:protein of unknown function DUF423 [Pseudopedobacter saltans DSM 12145]|uniref:DUF423 domain-containing protein n=1 Tax=Pseudopedobacter saltans (strain ATCC 51119 / DSM 12145 / JCM 21818 / CCUG 39354 / LMG 10337 / NBRC 100064 / NCIMB 13643) TaxID=762903 RepID=F0S849_PSESL|nr:DUF423 domain-containing protein [Pseudopedobacter saltans]ADY52311.1 protein of unknown function DUF423 [Pseudopedobacter saltans DSM 12145]
MNKRIIISAAFFGALAVIFGAFGAHALKNILSPYGLEIWNKGVQYQFYHTFALLFLSTFARYRNSLINFASYCFTFGIILFSGSLYLLALREQLNLGGLASILGPITPIGGLLFILGWIGLLLAAVRDK